MMTIEELYANVIDGLITKKYFAYYDYGSYAKPRGCTFRIDTYTDNYDREWRCETHHKFTVPKYKYRQGLITV